MSTRLMTTMGLKALPSDELWEELKDKLTKATIEEVIQEGSGRVTFRLGNDTQITFSTIHPGQLDIDLLTKGGIRGSI